MLGLEIWLIGWLFTAGFTMEQTKTLDEFGESVLLLLIWPLILGCYLREQIK